ncbi:MAG: alpha/beta fold hydrolase [Sphingomonas sp.]|nr:alpha/beta fold hydrolase [Sphingomonas sp.]
MLQAETAANPKRLRRALAGLARYQQAERIPPPAPMPAIATAEGARLRDYGGEGPFVLFVPSLINPPTVLDLGERSLLRWLAARGHRVLLLDWGWPDAARSTLSVAGHVERILLPLMAELGEPVDLVGYCLGGTMAAAAARPGRARSLATIAAPWHFNGFDDESRAALARLWDQSRAVADTLGVLPMEVLQSAFWNLDPARTVAKFEAFAAMTGDAAAAFVALEDWANDGPPLPKAAAREMMEDLFGADLTGTGAWRVAGEVVDPARIPAPMLHIVSTTDRIVPHASAFRAGERLDLALGHVGMVVGSRGRDALWQPLAAWLSRTAAKC